MNEPSRLPHLAPRRCNEQPLDPAAWVSVTQLGPGADLPTTSRPPGFDLPVSSEAPTASASLTCNEGAPDVETTSCDETSDGDLGSETPRTIKPTVAQAPVERLRRVRDPQSPHPLFANHFVQDVIGFEVWQGRQLIHGPEFGSASLRRVGEVLRLFGDGEYRIHPRLASRRRGMAVVRRVGPPPPPKSERETGRPSAERVSIQITTLKSALLTKAERVQHLTARLARVESSLERAEKLRQAETESARIRLEEVRFRHAAELESSERTFKARLSEEVEARERLRENQRSALDAAHAEIERERRSRVDAERAVSDLLVRVKRLEEQRLLAGLPQVSHIKS